MLNISYFPDRRKWNERIFHFECDFEFDYGAEIPESGEHLNITLRGEIIGEVNDTFVTLKNKKLPTKQLGIFSWGYLLSTSPEILLVPDDDGNYTINGKVIVRFYDSSETEDSKSVCFDENLVKPSVAFCLLVGKISRQFHSI